MNLQSLVAAIEGGQFPINWPGQWVDGRWLPVRKGGATKASHNPNDGKQLIEVSADKESVNAAVEASYAARSRIAQLPLQARMDILSRIRQSLTDYQGPIQRVLRLESGKAPWEARDDFDSAVRYLDWVASHGEEIFAGLLAPARTASGKASDLTMLPLGVTAAYLPFSTPLTSFVFYLGASVLAGCPLIINSSTHAILGCLLNAAILAELDLPQSLVNFVYGNFSSFKQLITDKRVAAVIYTGSREHCDQIRLESRAVLGRQSVLQSGGKNAVIVDQTADLEQAVKCVVYGTLKSSGQRCTSTSRVFVHRDLSQAFRERMVAAFGNVKVGRTDLDYHLPQEEPFMGPLYSAKAVDKYLRFQTMANRESERTLLWGKALEVEPKGAFVSPSLHYLTRFDNQSAYQGNVLFSPDVAIYDFEVMESAIEQLNTTDAAFAVSFIGDAEALAQRRHLFLAPNLLVNKPTVEMEATLPLAGRLHSGHHRFHGPAIALYLCYPQVLDRSTASSELIKSWPWPRI